MLHGKNTDKDISKVGAGIPVKGIQDIPLERAWL